MEGGVNHHPLRSDPQTLIIQEPDLYRLVMWSHLPPAEKFEAWIFEDVIPTIRKTGSYDVDTKALLNDPVYLRKRLYDMSGEVIELKEQNLEMTPKAQFADAVTASETSIAVGGLAKLMRQNWISAFHIEPDKTDW